MILICWMESKERKGDDWRLVREGKGVRMTNAKRKYKVKIIIPFNVCVILFFVYIIFMCLIFLFSIFFKKVIFNIFKILKYYVTRLESQETNDISYIITILV